MKRIERGQGAARERLAHRTEEARGKAEKRRRRDEEVRAAEARSRTITAAVSSA